MFSVNDRFAIKSYIVRTFFRKYQVQWCFLKYFVQRLSFCCCCSWQWSCLHGPLLLIIGAGLNKRLQKVMIKNNYGKRCNDIHAWLVIKIIFLLIDRLYYWSDNEGSNSLTFSQKWIQMFLLDLFAAKAAFIAMIVALIVIPVWILLVAFTKKKGKADSVNAPLEEETTKDTAEVLWSEEAEKARSPNSWN